VLQVLESYYSDARLIFGLDKAVPEETVYLNLLEISIPDKLHLADIDLDKDAVIEGSRNLAIRLTRRSSSRNIVRAALEQQGLSFAVDWVDYEGKIFTFHDLDDSSLPLNRVIDQGTITTIEPDEFYDVDENQERVFKSLLQRCLQQKLYRQQVHWQHQEHLYFFTEDGDANVRLERWPSNPIHGREVFKRFAKKGEPDKTLHYKHLAFRTAFQRFDNQWYLQIMPDWFFSSNRYRRSFYHEDNVKWLKLQEKNPQVFNELRFIVHFLRRGRQPELFAPHTPDTYPFLSFGELLTFPSPARVDDKEWLNKESSTERQRLDEAQQQLEFIEE
jgi:hypothetical protein